MLLGCGSSQHSRIYSFPGNHSRVAPIMTMTGNNETFRGLVTENAFHPQPLFRLGCPSAIRSIGATHPFNQHPLADVS